MARAVKAARQRLLLLVGAGLCLLSAPTAHSQNTGSTDAASTDAVPAPFWAKRITGYITATDGTRIAYSALLPKGDGPFPAIMNYSGYDPGIIGGPAYRRGETNLSPLLDKRLVERGYAVVGVNVRGSGCSEGGADFLAPTVGTDGRDAIEFIAQQSWSNGNVGMMGYSFPGITQLATAIEQPPHLKAIAPGMVVADLRLDNWAPGGVPQTGFAIGNANRPNPLRDRAREAAAEAGDNACLARLQKPSSGTRLAEDVFHHPLRDDWHRARRLSDRAHRIEVPVLSMETFQDEQTGPRGDYYQERLNPKTTWVVQSNGNHRLYRSIEFWDKHLLPFLDHYVKGEANGFDKSPHVTVWQNTHWAQPGPPQEVNLYAKPLWSFTMPSFPVKTELKTFWLGAEGRLNPEPTGKAEGRDSYDYPVPGPAVSGRGSPNGWEAQHPDWRKGRLHYTSPPLAAPMMLYGPSSVDLWMDASGGDADIQVTLTEVLPSGAEIYIQRGWLRLSARAIDEERSAPNRPIIHDDSRYARPILFGQPVLARIELTKMAHLIDAKSKIRIWIDTPYKNGDNIFSYYSVKGENRIYYGGKTISKIIFGVLDKKPDNAISDYRKCDLLIINQPCRILDDIN